MKLYIMRKPPKRKTVLPEEDIDFPGDGIKTDSDDEPDEEEDTSLNLNLPNPNVIIDMKTLQQFIP